MTGRGNSPDGLGGPPVAPDENGCFGWPRACSHHDDVECLEAELECPLAGCDLTGAHQHDVECLVCGKPLSDQHTHTLEEFHDR